LLHFVGQGDWSDQQVLAKVREMVLPDIKRHGPIEAWIFDDTDFPKKGAAFGRGCTAILRPVGQVRQLSGRRNPFARKSSCQLAVGLFSMELSMQKTGGTDVREGFDFLGYRVMQAKALRTGRWVGKLFIPKGKLSDLRHKIKVKVKGIPTGCSLAEVISKLDPVIVGWRNYAIRAYREFSHLDRWIWQR
jgi:hypothetical protein